MIGVDFDALCNGAVVSVLGEGFSYQPASGSAFDVSGMFAEPFRQQVFAEDGSAHWVNVAPSVGLRVADLRGGPAANDKIVRKKTGTAYRIAEPQPDGVGWIKLILKVSA